MHWTKLPNRKNPNSSKTSYIDIYDFIIVSERKITCNSVHIEPCRRENVLWWHMQEHTICTNIDDIDKRSKPGISQCI